MPATAILVGANYSVAVTNHLRAHGPPNAGGVVTFVIAAHPAYTCETFYSWVEFEAVDATSTHFHTYHPAVVPNEYQAYHYLEIPLSYQAITSGLQAPYHIHVDMSVWAL